MEGKNDNKTPYLGPPITFSFQPTDLNKYFNFNSNDNE